MARAVQSAGCLAGASVALRSQVRSILAQVEGRFRRALDAGRTVDTGSEVTRSPRGRDPGSAVFQGKPDRDGGIYALAKRCTHRGGPLHKGQVEGNRATCPWCTSARSASSVEGV